MINHWVIILAAIAAFGALSLKACNPVDVTFVVDSSDNVGRNNFAQELKFIKSTVNKLNVSPSGTHVGVVTYGSHVHNGMFLNQHMDPASLLLAVDTQHYMGGVTHTADAIKYTYEGTFSVQHGMRPNVPHIIVLLTDGPSSSKDDTLLQAQTAKENGVMIYSVGIGNAVNHDELMKVASQPSSRYLLSATNFESLDTLSGLTAAKICDEEQLNAGLLAAPSHSLSKADFTFLVDSSNSVGAENYEKLSGFVKNTIKQLDVGTNKVHVGLMQYSGHPSMVFPLDMYYSRPDLFQAVDGTTLKGGGTNTADALNYMSQQMFSSNFGARPQVPRIAVVVTDGGAVDEAALIAAADKARKNGIGLIAVGVGPHVDMQHLNSISNSNYHVNSYDDLKGLTGRILGSASQIHTTAPQTSIHGNPTDSCNDKIANCKDYGADVCTGYKQWSEDNCKKFCGLCPSVSLPTATCADKLTNCANYGYSACKNYAPWAHDNCQQFCGYCGSSAQSNGFYGQCFYKNKAYKHGEKWTDGCDYECTCENGVTGKYRCYNRCPVYYNIPQECTLVKSDACCLKPVCNFNQKLTEFQGSGHGVTTGGINVCVHNGNQYYQGQQWQNGCDSQCTCTDSTIGSYKCHSLCPTYSTIPSVCKMVKEPGQCCSKPVCEFNTQHGSFTGMGSISGNGVGTHPTAPPQCVDKINNCHNYDHSVCTSKDYSAWAYDNCMKTCGLCSHGTAKPGPNDKCIYNGIQYTQGQSWQLDCHTSCICENAIFGFYRCVDSCPTYNNLPPGCYQRIQPGECCSSVQCDSGKFISSTTNLHSLGNGGGIYMMGPGGQIIIPTSSSGIIPMMGTGGTGYQGPSISGCLYKGKLYIQGQQWDEGCSQSCACKDASTGLYSCRSRCPLYPYLPAGCTLLRDPNDPCCKVPDCTGVAAGSLTSHALMPVYQTSTTANSVVKPPNIDTLYRNMTGQVMFTIKQNGSHVVGPTSGAHSSGGIGYCYYKGHTYLQDVTWEDGCQYNCICQDASIGKYECIDKCVHYQNLPKLCYLIPDTQNPCCHVPFCPFIGVTNVIFGTGSMKTTTPPVTTTAPTTPRPEICIYKNGQHYSQGQVWFDGCDFKCSCDNAKSGFYRCVTRCAIFENVPKECTQQPDSKDPACCTVPVCNITGTHNQITGSGNYQIPTIPQGSITGVGKHPNIGYCEYKGNHYNQGQHWNDGCQYNCVCQDSMSGLYRCTEICTRWPKLPPGCRLVTDFANPCCTKPDCPDYGSITGQGHATPLPSGGSTKAPVLKYCVYKNVNYLQGQTWADGCNLRCRCENSMTGLYTCNQRCATYDNLPKECRLVTDTNDYCCKKPYCNFTGIYQHMTGSIKPNMIPTGVPAMITGHAQIPTPTPGPDGKIPTPIPIKYCEYKGVQYMQGQIWSDGCDYNCQCLDSTTGSYKCTEKCPVYPNLPPECRLVRDPANPCCEKPDCHFPSTIHHIDGHHTVSPTLGPGQTPTPYTLAPTPKLPRNVCVYKGQRYTQGQEWFDGCDFKCICEIADAGVYTCNDRCVKYPPTPPGCVMVADQTDPFCCKIPKCYNVPQNNGSVMFIPTVPVGVITGGKATPSPHNIPTPSGQTPGLPTTPGVPVPKDVCVYKGSFYQQGQKWSDGCDYNCECVQAEQGVYRCSLMCSKHPDLPKYCKLVRDVNNPCCMMPFCYPTGTTSAPISTGPTPIPRDVCLYNGVPFKQGQSWNDGCDFRCTCENEMTGSYRCDDRCAEYKNIPPNCQMITDPKDKCCRVPSCQPTMVTTLAPDLNPGHTPGPTPFPWPIPTGIPGTIHGTEVKPHKHANDSAPVCTYKGIAYNQGQKFQDGCSFNCVCEDSTTGRYACTQRCTQYFNIPSYCHMVLDPADPCCKKPVCFEPNTVTPTPGPGHHTVKPDHNIPQPKDVCIYKGKTYMTGQKFYDGCDKVCVCENGMTGFTRCDDRCPTFPPLPAECRLVADPNDPQCCKTTQCIPVPGENPTPLPTDHPVIYTNIPGYITGHGLLTPPTSGTPTVGPDGHTLPTHATPQIRHVCVYNGKQYHTGQKWLDGCKYNCECNDDMTGSYKCDERCPKYTYIPPQCKLVRDPKDFCCYKMDCDWTLQTPTPNPWATPAYHTTVSPGLPGHSTPTTGYPTPQPNARCVYKGAAYHQGQVWNEGCTSRCRCDNADKNIYTCFDRCPSYIPQPGCRMVTDPRDSCCQVQSCYIVPTKAPNTGPTKEPPKNPTAGPSPVPMAVTGVIVGTPPTKKPLTGGQTIGHCAYKNKNYLKGEHWEDGCMYRCECIDDMTGKYKCTERCPRYPQIPNYCTMVQDPNDICCEKPYCPVLAPTPSPNTVSTAKPVPGQTTVTPGMNPHIIPTPVKRDVCIYKNKAYTTGQQFYDGCEKTCICDNGMTGAMHCTDRCRAYPPQPGCVMVPDSRDPLCCQVPKCPTQSHTGVTGSITGHHLPPTPTPFQGPTDFPKTTAPGVPVHPHTYPTPHPQQKACVYKNNFYSQGQKWLDGCVFRCQCEDAKTGTYKCTDRCPIYPQLPANCHMEYDPADPCCKKPVCVEPNIGSGHHVNPKPVHTLAPGITPTPGQTPVPGHSTPTPSTNPYLQPNLELCVYNGVPFKQGQTWYDGCDKQCRCENAQMNYVNCNDRCASHPQPLQKGCVLTTDPRDQCCQIPKCPLPNNNHPNDTTLVPIQPGYITGSGKPPTGSNPSITGQRDVCVYHGKIYHQGQTWEDGCTFNCKCIDSTQGKYRCEEKCYRYPFVPSHCTMIQDPAKPCCQKPYCPAVPTQSPHVNGPSTPGHPHIGSTQIPVPSQSDLCVYKGNYYVQNQQWYDACDSICKCENASVNFYRCQQRCTQYDHPSCTMVPDPNDPSCCSIPNCPVPTQSTGVPPTIGFISPLVPSKPGYITGYGPIPTGMNPSKRHGCMYKGVIYNKGQRWDDGCQSTCECLADMTGLYRCSMKCTKYVSLPPRCILMKDPKEPCCQKPYCDYINPTPFPHGIPTLVPPTGTPHHTAVTPTPNTNIPQGFCVYKGSYYTQGQVWSDGCTKKCRCEDVNSGYYTCNERCRSFKNLPSNCKLKADPSDPCCLVPDCPVPSINTTPKPGTPTKTPIGNPSTLYPFLIPTVIPGTFTGMGGQNPGGNTGTGYQTFVSGGRSMCVYKGKTYTQSQQWDDGCAYKCECIDAVRGKYRCTDRCPVYYYLPPQCYLKKDPKDSCCRIADCVPTAAPTQRPSTQIVPVTTAAPTKPPDVCVYNGHQYLQGSTWNDGCAYKCTCDSAITNDYNCIPRCKVYSSLPTFCHLIADPSDNCCETPKCTLPSGQVITPMVPGIGGTASPTLGPTVQYVLPIGTHSVFTGSNLPPGNAHYQMTGGRPACIYKGKIYRQGVSWNDGCDYVCTCTNAVGGSYKCVSKCPKYPPVPHYCKFTTVPGQCCPTLSCNIKGYGNYYPVPELVPTAAPTAGPDGHIPTMNPHVIITPNQVGGVSGFHGGGTPVPTGSSFVITSIRDKCIYNNKMYNQGETWDDGCKYSCECMDALSGFFKCTPKCPIYQQLPSDCSMVSIPDTCCPVPMCKKPDGTMENPLTTPNSIFPVVGSFMGGISGFRPGYIQMGSSFTGQRNVCVYKNVIYNQGVKWDDGCDFSCECVNAAMGQYLCQPKCPSYTTLPGMCRLISVPGRCCKELNCHQSTTKPTSTPSPQCTDVLANCEAYGANSCKAPYLEWAQKNCYATCFCAHPSKSCVDKLDNCAQYGQSSCSGIYLLWAKENCNKTCNLCNGSTPVVTTPQPTHPTHTCSSTCRDKLSNCKDFGASACVAPYLQWAHDNCPCTCGICDGTGHITGHGGSTIGYNQGWYILMKGVAGAPGDLYNLWSSSKTLNENVNQAKDLTATYKGHYKPDLTNHWNDLCLERIKVSVYNNGVEKAYIIFDARGADKMSWFTPNRIISSTYNDIKTAKHAMFTMAGDPTFGREFYISNKLSGCDSYGWIMISTGQQCFFEYAGEKPSFFYAPSSQMAHWGFTNPGSGDVFAIQGQGSCAIQGTTRPPITGTSGHYCIYGNNLYTQDQTWIDGCKYNCSCEDAVSGTYRCRDLCPTYTHLPPGCTLVKPPGECCAKPNCTGGTSSGCFYKGHTYAQGQKWDDGCDFKCECTDGATGRYQCQTKCLIWNLPAECHFNDPPPGKCCKIPVCPQGITIKYPDNYHQE